MFFCVKRPKLAEESQKGHQPFGGTIVKLKTAAQIVAGIALTGVVGAYSASAEEVLPWANQPIAPVAEAAPANPDPAATEAAAAQCAGLFEASCRDLKTCAWIADIALKDGTTVPARCVARPPAPPKSTNKAATKPKKTAAPAPATAPAAPAVKAAVTRIEDEEAPAKPPAAKVETKKTAVIETEPAEAPPVVEKKAAGKRAEPAKVETEAAAAPAEEPAKEPEKKAETAKAPIVVKPPASTSSSEHPPMPSFGSISPVMPGGSNAVVVTVPMPAKSE